MDIQSYTQRVRSVIQSAKFEAVTHDHQQLSSLHIHSKNVQDELAREVLAGHIEDSQTTKVDVVKEKIGLSVSESAAA